MDELLRSGPAVDGIVCHNDVVAFGVQRALRTHGVPADGMPSVISYDDIATADVEPDLEKAVRPAVSAVPDGGHVVVFSTYTAMWALHAVLQRIGVPA